jgi:hypothetical protein
MSSSTLSGNSSSGILNFGFAVTIGDTILNAGASETNIASFVGTVTSAGYNLSSDNGAGFLTATSDQINTDPLLGPLADNGGPTFTHAVLDGSPAMDAGKRDAIPALALNTDQRGLPRPATGSVTNAVGGDSSDIGAFEAQAGQSAVTCTLTPALATNAVGTVHTVTATVTTMSGLAVGTVVTFDVISGPNNGQSGTTNTDVNGQGSFAYTSNGTPGTDIIQAIASIGGLSATGTATKVWVAAQCTCPDLTGTWSNLVQTCKTTSKGLQCKVKGQLIVQNIGCVNAPTSFVRYYLSSDGVQTNTFLKQVATGTVKLGKPKKKTLSAKLAADVNGSGQFIIAVIDADNTVVECDETNNIVVSDPLP